ncbi:LexA-DNA-bind domain-containing protein [Erwinia rhapontici]|uniref:LexA family protein n=1 Tax=Erwinia rhapontici TaxID=55212 RepID=UPI003D362735
MPELTEIQKNVCRFIRDYSAENGYAPSRQDMCDNFGWKSCNAAEAHIKALMNKGAISNKPRKPRTLKVLIDV